MADQTLLESPFQRMGTEGVGVDRGNLLTIRSICSFNLQVTVMIRKFFYVMRAAFFQLSY